LEGFEVVNQYGVGRFLMEAAVASLAVLKLD